MFDTRAKAEKKQLSTTQNAKTAYDISDAYMHINIFSTVA